MSTYPLAEKTLQQIRQTYDPKPINPNGTQVQRCMAIAAKSKELALLIAGETAPSREQSLALTCLEDATMWANVAITKE